VAQLGGSERNVHGARPSGYPETKVNNLFVIGSVIFLCLTSRSLGQVAKAGAASGACPAFSAPHARALPSISSANLQADLSFLSSDVLAGRFSPSLGLNIAAEFIASRFRGAGLQPGGVFGYFQPAILENNVAKPPESQDLHGPETVNNVIAVLPGSDPVLKKTYVFLTAHYDHLGTTKTAGREAADHPLPDSADQIYNGANDDGSGTISVLAIAQALAKLQPHPKRSIVFALFFGEELGLLGSRYYIQRPTVPIRDIVAEVNLEQIGRTDSTEGPELNRFSLTGTGYSTVPPLMKCAAARVGVSTYIDDGNDDYFTRSDNISFASKGIPAHTLCVAFDFPDYHRVSDEWQKINYQNMARVDRAIAVGILDLANCRKRPVWNLSNAKTTQFHDAQHVQ
jgi:Peptidase family M28